MKPIYATWMISNNIGDALTPWLIQKITGQTPLYVAPEIRFPKYMVTGSVLNHASDYTTVWGAGFANSDDVLKAKVVLKVVRGPLTKERAEFQAGIPVEVVGDPALLMPQFYDPRNKQRHNCYDGQGNVIARTLYKVGICPHYVHQQEVKTWLAGRTDIKLLNVFDSPEQFVEDLISCQVIYSSSLHGLILADAYGVPRRWFTGTAPLGGDGFKFADYFALVGHWQPGDIAPQRPHLYQLPMDVDALYEQAVIHKPPDIAPICRALWDACPFRPERAEEKKRHTDMEVSHEPGNGNSGIASSAAVGSDSHDSEPSTQARKADGEAPAPTAGG